MIADPIAVGVRRGWNVRDASAMDGDLHLDADAVVIGTGAGGATAAETLARAGLRVVMIEEGPLQSSRDFHMLEREAYPALYQESAARKTKDGAITILQGRAVGGSTVVNWTSTFRAPAQTLAYWREHYGLNEYTPELLGPWFDRVERRLAVAPWRVAPNANNAVLQRGAAALGIPTGIMSRNVKGCANLGYCGMGCPTNAKQSMLVTAIPAALDRGAVLVHHARAERFTMEGGRVADLRCSALAADRTSAPHRVIVRARAYVAAGGGIGTPALLLRSGVPDPYGLLGRRTFLHPVVLSAAIMPEVVAAYAGAPQSVYSDRFMDAFPLDGPAGFKLEVPPVHPLLAAVTMPGFGASGAGLMAAFPHLQVILALLRDGFHEQSPGGTVELASDGSPVLDYPISGYLWDGMRRAFLAMAQIQFAAGAKRLLPVHESAWPYTSWDEAKTQIAALPMETLLTRVVSAHVMGGCAMGADARAAVVDGDGRHHLVENLYAFDGSVFPTSLGTNPQLTIYAVAARMASRLARRLGGRSEK
jgi:choline dehydrogenase-like flavoprotein